MKRWFMISLGSLGLLAGSANAGEGCWHGSIAAQESEQPIMAAAEETEAQMLARLKAEEEASRLEKLLETPATYN